MFNPNFVDEFGGIGNTLEKRVVRRAHSNHWVLIGKLLPNLIKGHAQTLSHMICIQQLVTLNFASQLLDQNAGNGIAAMTIDQLLWEIGRASCRERGGI